MEQGWGSVAEGSGDPLDPAREWKPVASCWVEQEPLATCRVTAVSSTAELCGYRRSEDDTKKIQLQHRRKLADTTGHAKDAASRRFGTVRLP